MTDSIPGSAGPRGDARTGSRTLVGRGAREAERLVLEELDSLLPATPAGLELLAEPVRLVVPSRSLRRHLCDVVLRRHGRARAGLLFHALRGLALEILDRSGEPTPRPDRLLPLLAVRAARDEPALEPLVAAGGGASAAASVRDLLSAGLDATAVEALEELLADPDVHLRAAERERAAAIVRVAARCLRELEASGTTPAPLLLARAAELLARDPERVLPSRAILVHGFADATGRGLDLLEAVLRHPRARLVLDRPPDPARPDREDEGVEFARRLTERLAPGLDATPPAAMGSDSNAAGAPPSSIAITRASGASAEIREVAGRIGRLLEEGQRPEGIGVVARRLGTMALPVRRELERVGVPFSGVGGAGPPGPLARLARSLGRLLEEGGELPADVWLELVQRLGRTEGGLGPLRRADLRVAAGVLGAARLRDVAGIDASALSRVLDAQRRGAAPREERLRLPVRTGLGLVGADRDRVVSLRRKVERPVLESLVSRARAVLERLERWPERAPAPDHFGELEALLDDDLGWRRSERVRPLRAALRELAEDVPAGTDLEREELVALAVATLSAVGLEPLGGGGGGVQLLDALEARGRTFDHLFVVGLERDAFPLPAREDPLLPDAVRAPMRALLPDLAIKRDARFEERYLFAQLLSSSPAVTLSWQAASDEGRAQPPSPFLERLRLARGFPLPAVVPRLRAPAAPPEGGAPPERTPDELAVLAGSFAPRRRFADLLPAVARDVRCELQERREPSERDGEREVTAADREQAARRLAVLEELDPDLHAREGRRRHERLGPWHGLVGALPSAGPVEADPGSWDPRRPELAVTRLEGLARCSWQAFLEKVLGLEPPPDPLARVPEISARVLGSAAHDVLERLVRERDPGRVSRSLSELVDAPPLEVPWPGAVELRERAASGVRDVLTREGLVAGGLEPVLVERVVALLEAARPQSETARVLGAELSGEVELGAEGERTPVAFRADRVDVEDRGIVLVDFKTGRPVSDGAREQTRRKHLVQAVRSGSKLQAGVYALALRDLGRAGLGRYLFLGEELESRHRVAELEAGDTACDEVARVVATLLEAWRRGTLPPRLVEPDGSTPSPCRWCDVAEACLQGESGARRRMAEWARRHEEGTAAPPGAPAEASTGARPVQGELFSAGGRDPGSVASSSRRVASSPPDETETAVLALWRLRSKGGSGPGDGGEEP